MNPLGKLFDAPNAVDCYRRTETVIPQQALALTNSELVHSLSAAIVQQWPPARNSSGEVDRDAFLDASFQRILTRSPTPEERRICLESMDQQSERLTAENVPDPELRACEAIIRVLFNHNDFVTIR